MEALLRSLDAYRPQRDEKKQSKIETLGNASKFFKRREMVVNTFKEGLSHCLNEHHHSKRKMKTKTKKKIKTRTKTKNLFPKKKDQKLM